MNGRPNSLRILSYNVRSLRDDARAVARIISRCDPDVVCVQEAPRFLFGRRKCRALARRSGLVVVTGGRPAGAMLLLARPGLQVPVTRDVKLTKRPRLHQRGLAIAVVQAPGGGRLTLASMHLDLDAGERRRHVAEILGILGGFRDPLVLAGDVNEEPDAPAWQALAAGLQDAYAVAPVGAGETIPAHSPDRRLDAIFVDPRLRVLSCGVPDHPELARASDHRPVLAVVAGGRGVR